MLLLSAKQVVSTREEITVGRMRRRRRYVARLTLTDQVGEKREYRVTCRGGVREN